MVEQETGMGLRNIFLGIATVALLSAFMSTSRDPKPAGDAVVHFAFGDSVVGWAAGYVRTGGIKRYSDDTTTIGADSLYRSMIMKTTDGGRSWSLQTVLQSSDESIDILTLFAQSRSHAWIVAHRTASDRTFLLRTRDGMTWNAMNFRTDLQPSRLFFQAPDIGWMIAADGFGSDRILKSTDGGVNWHEEGIPFHGRFYDILFEREVGYILAAVDNDPLRLTILKTTDGGRIWIAATMFEAESGAVIEGSRLRLEKSGGVVAEVIHRHEDYEEYGNTVMYMSTDGFVTFMTRRAAYDKDSKQNESLPTDVSVSGDEWIAIDAAPTDHYIEASKEFVTLNLVASPDQGRTWTKRSEFHDAVYNLRSSNDLLVLSSAYGEILISDNGGQSWHFAKMDFRGVYYLPRTVPDETTAFDDLFAFGEESEFDQDSIYQSRWESAEDSLAALSFASNVDISKYKPRENADFAVGIDSISSSTITFHKRVRWGARIEPWDLIREEAKTGEIRVRKYKTIRFAGRVHAVNGRQVKRVLWTSSISGDLSDKVSFTTHPRQLPPGTHFIFFKAQNDLGQWSESIVTKVVVEDFPKYRFPFDGEWTAGGGGSYYNKGWHIRGIRYALDLNYPGNEGGDSDYGMPVRAATDGIVSFAGYIRGYGRTVRIDYEYGGKTYATLTSHLATISVRDGQQVRQGQEIGTCGSTGRSSAPHVHWELRVDGVCVPPEPVFENDSTIIQSIHNGQSFRSDNRFDDPTIVTVDEPDIPNTWREYRGYWHSYRYAGVSVKQKTVDATWKPKLPVSGRYRVEVHIPKKFATALATYRIHTRNGVHEFKVNQNKFTDEFVDIGTYDFDASDDVVVTLDNATGQRRGHIAFDAVRFILLDPGTKVGTAR
jgi:murein DD-endopeptidase MepM/ murein hydrolase activator NlpD/photosystem II stability/assembly factor-like uncharacterized protein